MSKPANKCAQCNRAFEITSDDRAFYEKMKVPAPKLCPDCRFQRRLNERNTRHLYYRKCSFSGEEIISQYHDQHPFPVYKPDIWWSDKWDALDFGQEFDFQRPFFEQFQELKNKVPHMALFVTGAGTMHNSDFTNCTGYLKNCYLIFESDYNEDCYYSNLLKKSQNLVDCSFAYESQRCYECIDCISCYNVLYSHDCNQCRDSYFLSDCISCSDCIGCINQRHKQYMVFNKQYSKEEYLKIKERLLGANGSQLQQLKQQCLDFFKTQVHKDVHTENNENSLGDHLYNSKNARFCFDSKDLEDCTYCARLSLNVKSSMDYNSWGDKAELVYYSSSCGDGIYNIKFCTTCATNVRDSEYCDQCSSSADLFGCVGVRKKQYCILNRQYSKKDYFALREKIIANMKKTGEYGEFFPNSVCPFGYNETTAMDYFPLTKEQAEQAGYKWKEDDHKNVYQGPKVAVPESIGEVSDDITKEILTCDQCHKNYKIIAQELRFYRDMSIPIPKVCPNCRHQARLARRNPARLWERQCGKCQTAIQTTYSPERKEMVYCEKCYQEAVY